MSSPKSTTTVRIAVSLGLMIAGFVIGRATGSPPRLEAAASYQPQPKAFKSGGARSIAVLKEISATLKTTDKRVADMDKRVAGIEKLLQKIAKDKPKE